MEELIEQFSLKKVQKGGAIVNVKKLDWINSQHTKIYLQDEKKVEMLVNNLKPLIKNRFENNSSKLEFFLSENYIKKVIFVIQDRISVLNKIVDLCPYFFVDPDYSTPKAISFRSKLWKANSLFLLDLCFQNLSTIDVWDKESINLIVHSLTEKHNLKDHSEFFVPLRYVLTATQGIFFFYFYFLLLFVLTNNSWGWCWRNHGSTWKRSLFEKTRKFFGVGEETKTKLIKILYLN